MNKIKYLDNKVFMNNDNDVDDDIEDNLDKKMLKKHKSEAILDLVKLCSSTPTTTSTSSDVKLNKKMSIMSPKKISINKNDDAQIFNYNSFLSRFNNFGKEIMNVESKTKRMSKSVDKNLSKCDNVYQNMGKSIKKDHTLLRFSDIMLDLQ